MYKRQVLCVTHLPQVACHGHHQFNVEKFTVDDKTETKMTALSQDVYKRQGSIPFAVND